MLVEMIDTLAIVGIGLIGGSIARAARQRGVVRRVVAIDRDPVHRDNAVALGLADAAFADLNAVTAAEVVVVCTPVDRIAGQVCDAARLCPPTTLLTDVGSTKADIVRAVEAELSGPLRFVGGHPLAGSEKNGPQHADPHLFRDRLTVLTPTPRTDPDAVERASAFWQALGARVRLMPPQEHDEALALTSHLPHLLASALAGLLPDDCRDLAATGFRDMTRLAAGDPELWAAIFRHNRGPVMNALARYLDRLDDFREALESADAEALAALLQDGRLSRQEFDSGWQGAR